MSARSISDLPSVFADNLTAVFGGFDDLASWPMAEAASFGAGLTQALYLTEAGDISAISQNDIHQGQIGDCSCSRRSANSRRRIPA